jgi:hypothetical protein
LNHSIASAENLISSEDYATFLENVKCSTEKNFESVRRQHISKFERLVNHNPHHVPESQPPMDSNKWLINLTEVQIPSDVQNVLKLGEKHSVPFSNKNLPLEELISCVESSIYLMDDLTKREIRNKMTNILTNFKNSPRKLSTSEINFSILHNKAKNFLREHPSILVLSADKGNITVIMDRTDYDNKVQWTNFQTFQFLC